MEIPTLGPTTRQVRQLSAQSKGITRINNLSRLSKKCHLFNLFSQAQSQLWDFRREYPEVGVVVAGGSGGGNGGGKEVYQSLDFGQTSTYLTDIPYGGDILYNGCLVIVDETTVFVGAGFSELST